MSLLESLQSDTVSDVGIDAPLAVPPSTSILDAVKTMRRESVGCIAVCDTAEKLLGVFTEKDLVTRVLAVELAMDTPIERVMTDTPAVIKPTDNVRQVIRHMSAGSFRHMPVVDDQKKFVGILSVRHVVQYLIDHFPNAIYTLPPTPRPTQVVREGA